MRLFRNVKVMLALCAMLGFARYTYAASVPKNNCAVTAVQFDNSNRLVIFCSGDPNIYFAFTYQDGTGCGVQTLDTLKVWASMAQAALLSGRQIDFWFDNACGADKVISSGFKLH
jgi:hypothetical protein